MEQIQLVTAPRTVIGKQTRALRRSGYVPMTLYGPSLQPVNLQAEALHLRRVLTQAGTTRLIYVQVGETAYPALARDIQRNPIRGDFIHVDLYAVDIHKAITTTVPIVVVGDPEIVRTNRAVLSHAMDEIEIECLPTDLPPAVHIDISGLKEVGDAVYVRDLKPIPGVAFLSNPEDLIAKIIPLAAAPVEPVAVVAEPTAEVEVVKKGKGEEEEEGEAEK
jgi:large subunit ribosomal protein L25